MRILCLMVLTITLILDIGPIPIADLFLIGIVLFRPDWFFQWVVKIYRKQ